VDRLGELAEIEVKAAAGHTVLLLVCTVPDCPEYCRVFVDLRDDWEQAGGSLLAPSGGSGPGVRAEPDAAT
jgi:hypothetical protein